MKKALKQVKQTVNVILIDPIARSIAMVETTTAMEHLQQLIQTDYVESLRGERNNLILFGENPKPSAGGFYLSGVYVKGRAVIVGTEYEMMVTPSVDVGVLRHLVSFA